MTDRTDLIRRLHELRPGTWIYAAFAEAAADLAAHEERRCRAARLLDAAGLPTDAARDFILEAEAASMQAAHASVRPNGEVFAETFEALVDFRAHGDPDGSKRREFDAEQAFKARCAAMRGIRWGIWS